MKKALLFTFIVAAFAAYYFLVAKKKKTAEKKKDTKKVSDSSANNSTVPSRPIVGNDLPDGVLGIPQIDPHPLTVVTAPSTVSRDSEPAPTVSRGLTDAVAPTHADVWRKSDTAITVKSRQLAGGTTQDLKIKNYLGRDHALGNDGKVYIWENRRWTLKK